MALGGRVEAAVCSRSVDKKRAEPRRMHSCIHSTVIKMEDYIKNENEHQQQCQTPHFITEATKMWRQ